MIGDGMGSRGRTFMMRVLGFKLSNLECLVDIIVNSACIDLNILNIGDSEPSKVEYF